MKPKIGLTGATGFVGSALLKKFVSGGSSGVAFIRGELDLAEGFQKVSIEGIHGTTNYEDTLLSLDCIIHAAARVHVMKEDSVGSLEKYRDVNTFGTLNLARQAARSGVRRFIFISSIKVNGESTELGKPFVADESVIPTDPYALSKFEAEEGLKKISDESRMEVVIIRPPLVYGPGVGGNFASMLKWVYRGVPLPLGGIRENRRSLVSINNLTDLIYLCVDHPLAADQTFLVSDDDDLSSATLLTNLALAFNVPDRSFSIPDSWIKILAFLLRKPQITQRLFSSLQVDITKTKEMLNWSPIVDPLFELKQTVDHFKKSNYE